MRKLLLLIPVGLFAVTGFFWVAMNPFGETSSSIEATPASEEELFARSESSLRQIVRRGDSQSVSTLTASLDTLTSRLVERGQNDTSIQKIDALLISYRQDTSILTQKIAPHMVQLQKTNQYESQNHEKFLSAMDQIGLYELITAYQEMDKLRKHYIKDPSEETIAQYETKSKRIHTIIAELYLDERIEKPLFDYLDNHRTYFRAITAAYRDIGVQRINRLRANGYAIRSAFQLLPTS